MTARTDLPRPLTHVEECMGTVFSFRIMPPGVPTHVLAAVLARLHAIDAMFSTYRPDSQISRLNAATLALADASPDVRTVLRECERFEHLTDGYFSARPDGKTLDPSGYVKGWAVQQAADTLSAAGSLNHYVNGGGDVICAGTPQPGRGWRIGITDPHDGRRLLDTIEGTGPLAIATSGTAERGHHVLDPHDGTPATQLVSATVVAHDLITADVYATAVLAMGPQRGRTWLGDRREIEAILVLPDGRQVDVKPSTSRPDQSGSRSSTRC
jgi:thiamine biosynthesis lipoprotein